MDKIYKKVLQSSTKGIRAVEIADKLKIHKTVVHRDLNSLYHKGKRHRASAYLREHLEPGNRISGPALIVDQESTTFLPPSYSLRVDGLLNIIMGKTIKSDE